MAKIKQETTNTTVQLTGKFGPKGFLNAIKGRPSTKQKDGEMSFSGQVKVVKDDNKTATKIKPLEQGNQLLDILLKIHDFIKKSNEEDILRREKDNNFRESRELAEAIRHKKLLDALKGQNVDDNKTATKDTDDGMGIFDIISSMLDAFGGLESIINVGKFFASAELGAMLLGGLPLLALGLGAYWAGNADINNPGYNPIAIAGAEGKKFADFYNEYSGRNKEISERREQNKADSETASPVTAAFRGPDIDKTIAEYEEKLKTAKPSERPGLEITLNQFKKIKKQQEEKAGKKEEKKSEVESPAAPVAPSAAPAVSLPKSAPSVALNKAVAENNDVKLKAVVSEPSVETINNVVAENKSKEQKAQNRAVIPAVRNQEETFQRMIYYSTRVV